MINVNAAIPLENTKNRKFYAVSGTVTSWSSYGARWSALSGNRPTAGPFMLVAA